MILKRFDRLTGSALMVVAVTLSACDSKQARDETAATEMPAAAASALPAGLFVSEPPSGARSVGDVKADASVTGDVVIRGRIGGRKQPFVQGAAVFLLADSSMKTCNELHDADCPTPWDYCCEPRESLHAKTATIQVVGADGKPLRERIRGSHGMKPQAEIVVAGKVAHRDEAGTLVVNADKIYVLPSKD